MATGYISLSFCVLAIALPAIVSGHGAIPYNWFDHPQWIKVNDGETYDFVGMKSEHVYKWNRYTE